MPHSIAGDELQYEKKLATYIRQLIENSSIPLSLFEIIRLSEGATPTDIVKILDQNKLVYYTDEKAGKLTIKNKIVQPANNTTSSLFAASHPADYDWRFTQQTINELLSYVKEYTLNTIPKVALLGVHTLYPTLSQMIDKVTLFNKSQSILSDLNMAGYKEELIDFDLFNPAGEYTNNYNTAVADPPWYVDYYQAFIDRSAEFLTLDGFLLLSVLPRLTRPSAESDQRLIMRIAEKSGFKLMKKIPKLLEYETPGFEQVAFATQGIYCQNWRMGDLWIFQKKRQIQTSSINSYDDTEPIWAEFRVGDRKIKVKQLANESNYFDYETADPSGKFFSNISRRSPLRNKIDVWTSDNLAFSITQASTLMTCLTILERKGTIEEVALYLDGNSLLSDVDRLKLLNLIAELT